MKLSFYVLGDGAGHQTQAMSLAEELCINHELTINEGIGLNHSPKTFLFDFCQKNKIKHNYYHCPSFVYHRGALSLTKTVLFNLKNIFKLRKSFQNIKRSLVADKVINFYEPLASFLPHKNKYFIGHQLMFLHPNYIKNKLSFIQRINYNFLAAYTKFISFNHVKLALSFYNAGDYKDIVCVPPILRKEVFTNNFSESDEEVCVYLTELGYLDDLILLAQKNQDKKFFIFGKFKYKYQMDNLNLSPISDKFLDVMKKSKYIISTSGFETLSEAVVLNKVIFFNPLPNHFEQEINSIDAQNCGIGIKSDIKNIDFNKSVKLSIDKNWFQNGVNMIIKQLGL